MFFSIAFSLQQNANDHHRAQFKSLENTPTWCNQHHMHRAHQSHYLYCIKASRIGSVHSGNIGWVSDQFHNAHGSVLMGLLDVYRVSRMQVNWNSYRPRWLCRSLKYQDVKSIIGRMVPRWSENKWNLFWGKKRNEKRKKEKDAASEKDAGGDDQLVFFYLACLGVWLYNLLQCCEVFYLCLKINNFKGPMKWNLYTNTYFTKISMLLDNCKITIINISFCDIKWRLSNNNNNMWTYIAHVSTN